MEGDINRNDAAAAIPPCVAQTLPVIPLRTGSGRGGNEHLQEHRRCG